MHFGVFCVQFHRPRACMNKISNVLESSIALAAVAGRRLAARLFHCSIHRYLVQSLQPVENGRYGHTPIRSDTSIRVYTTADADTDTSTPCVGVPATSNIRPGRSLRERSLDAMGGTCRPLATHKLARSVSFMTG